MQPAYGMNALPYPKLMLPFDRSRATNGPVWGTLYLWGVGLISIVLLAHVARVGHPYSAELSLAAEFVLLAAVAQHFPLEFGPQRKTDMSIAVYFVCVLLFSAGAALILVGVSQFVGQATLALRRAPGSGKRLRGPRGVLFNTSQLVIATALASAVYGAFIPRDGLFGLGRAENLWAVPAAAVVLHLANSLSVAVMAALQLRQSVVQTWITNWRTRAVERAGLLLVGLIAALTVGQYPWAPVLMAFPAGILFLAQRRALELLTAEQLARADAVRAQKHVSLLAHASAALASSLDCEATLESAVHLTVPELADCSAISINRDDEPRRNWAVAATSRVQEEQLRQLLLHGWSPATAADGSARSEWHPVLTESLLDAWSRDAEALRLLRELGPTSAIIVPLFARDQALGKMTLFRTVSPRGYESTELALAEDLADRIALALDNARLYEEQQRIVRRLQQLRVQIEANERVRLLGDERDRMARELHDRVEQTFFSIGLSISALLAAPESTPVAALRATLNQIRSSAKQGAEELRAAIFALTRTEIYDRGLVRALWQLVREFQARTGLEADLVESGSERRLSPEISEVFHAVVREGLANVEQHAQASAVVVSLRFEPNLVALTVQDDGVGASVLVLNALEHSATRFGLRGLRDRVLRLHGQFSAQRGEDGGFVVRACVPLNGTAAL